VGVFFLNTVYDKQDWLALGGTSSHKHSSWNMITMSH